MFGTVPTLPGIFGYRFLAVAMLGAYLLLPARWFPLTAYPTNRYTATFRMTVPETFALAGTGKSLSPSMLPAKSAAEGARLQYVFECPNAAPNGSFVAGPLQLSAKQAEGVNVNVFAPRSASAKPEDFANSIARSVNVFSDLFGALPSEPPESSDAEKPRANSLSGKGMARIHPPGCSTRSLSHR